MAAEERKFDKDKVYLQDGNGVIWPYEALLANNSNFKQVIPNPSKKEEEVKKDPAK